MLPVVTDRFGAQGFKTIFVPSGTARHMRIVERKN
jgi:hypothetical protein